MNENENFLTLGIETSCDDTGVAILKNEREVLCEFLSSQIKDHSRFGGVIPEFAARKHLENLLPLIDAALKETKIKGQELNLIAVTRGPGLMGSLIVGVQTAKALSQVWNVPLIGVNHLEGHIFANFLSAPNLEPPFLALVVSGGHSSLIKMTGYNDFELIGQTRDDAAGEAFDKIARVMNLPYPGGPQIDKLAKEGNSNAIDFPRAKVSDFDFSFSGLKSAVLNYLNTAQMKGEEINKADVAASFQKAVIDSLIDKTIDAAEKFKLTKIVLAGGVAANSSLEENLRAGCKSHGLEFFYPTKILCTDNAAMIACRGYYQSLVGDFAKNNLNAIPNLSL